MKVAVIGASDKQDRYSYKAVMLLKEKGHEVFPVHPRVKEIEGQKVYASVKDIPAAIDTVTLYVGADISSRLEAELLAVHPGRMIFNPGAENRDLASKARGRGIMTVDACTLVMLTTGQF